MAVDWLFAVVTLTRVSPVARSSPAGAAAGGVKSIINIGRCADVAPSEEVNVQADVLSPNRAQPLFASPSLQACSDCSSPVIVRNPVTVVFCTNVSATVATSTSSRDSPLPSVFQVDASDQLASTRCSVIVDSAVVPVVTFTRRLAEWIVDPRGICPGPFPNKLSNRIRPALAEAPPIVTVVDAPFPVPGVEALTVVSCVPV